MEPNTNSAPRLKIDLRQEGDAYTFFLEGRLDTLTSPDLEDQVDPLLGTAKELVFDLEKLIYISSAGLRVLVGAAQEMEDRGEVILRHLSPPVQDVFDVTGFTGAFRIE